jgi:hypothetical protein
MINILDKDEIRSLGKVLLCLWQHLIYPEADMAFIELDRSQYQVTTPPDRGGGAGAGTHIVAHRARSSSSDHFNRPSFKAELSSNPLSVAVAICGFVSKSDRSAEW